MRREASGFPSGGEGCVGVWVCGCVGVGVGVPTVYVYSRISLIRASVIRMPHNPNTLHVNLFYHFLLAMIQ